MFTVKAVPYENKSPVFVRGLSGFSPEDIFLPADLVGHVRILLRIKTGLVLYQS